MLLEVLEGTVSEIAADSQVTRLTIGDELVWMRTSRSRLLPLSAGDRVTVIAGRFGRQRTLIAIRFRRHRDRHSFGPHRHSSIPLQLAASLLLFARATFKRSDLGVARVAVAPLAAFGADFLQTQGYIVAGHVARMSKSRPAAIPIGPMGPMGPMGMPAEIITMPRSVTASSAPLALGMQGAPPSADTPWWHSELLECTNDAIIIWEMDGAGILYWNQAAEQLYGYSRDEAHGKVTHDLLRTATRKPVKELESVLARYGVWIGELRHTTRDGRVVKVEGRMSLMSQRSGRWLVLEVNRDVTDVNRAAAAGAAREASLSHLTLER